MLSHYSIHLRLTAGVENLSSDYAGQNPNECLDIDVKHYLKDVVTIADDLLIVRDHQPFQPPRELCPGWSINSSFYIRFSHPLKYQTKCLFTRYFFALDVDRAIDKKSPFLSLSQLRGNAKALVVPSLLQISSVQEEKD